MQMKPVFLVAEILAAAIREAGGDGLVYPEIECGCVLDDLIACQSDPSHCRVGWSRTCKRCGVVFLVADRNSERTLCGECVDC
jgi:hypothetical protein